MGLISLIAGGIMDANKAIKQKQAKADDTVQNVVIKNLYSIDVPSFLSPTTKLSEDASLQYWNKTLDIAFQVIDEPKSEIVELIADLDAELPEVGKGNTLLEKLAALTISNMFDMDKVEMGNYNETTINGLKALMFNVFQKRSFFKDALYGSFAFVEGANNFYQIIILSGGTSIRDLADKLEESIRSFKEL